MTNIFQTHSINVWYIYLHYHKNQPNEAKTYHTWMVWAICFEKAKDFSRLLSGFLTCRFLLINTWVFPKMVVPNNPSFPTKNDHFGVFWGNPPFKETPTCWLNNGVCRESHSRLPCGQGYVCCEDLQQLHLDGIATKNTSFGPSNGGF